MIEAIPVTTPHGPLATVNELNKYLRGNNGLTPEYCRVVLSKGRNTGVAVRLLSAIKSDLEQHPQKGGHYSGIIGAMWYNAQNDKAKNPEANCRNIQKMAELVANYIEPTPENADIFYALRLEKEHLADDINGILAKKTAVLPPFEKEVEKNFFDNLLYAKVKAHDYTNLETGIVPEAVKSPELLKRVAEELFKQGRLKTIDGQDVWNLSVWDKYIKGSNPTHRLPDVNNIPEEFLRSFPWGAAALLKGFPFEYRFYGEPAEKMIKLMTSLENTFQDVPYLSEAESCYKILSGMSKNITQAERFPEREEAKEINSCFARLLHVFNRDKTPFHPKTKEEEALAVLLAAVCGREDLPKEKISQMLLADDTLKKDDLIALTYDYAAKNNFLEYTLQVGEEHFNVLQLKRPPADYLPYLSGEDKYNFIKSFCPRHLSHHSRFLKKDKMFSSLRKEWLIDEFPDLALGYIGGHEFFEDTPVAEATKNLLKAAAVNIEVIKAAPHLEEDTHIMRETALALVLGYNATKDREDAKACHQEIYHHIMKLCADETPVYRTSTVRDVMCRQITNETTDEKLVAVTEMSPEKIKRKLNPQKETTIFSRFADKIFSAR